MPKGWPDLSVACGGDGWPWLRIDSERAAMIMVGSTEFRPIGPQTWDPAVRRADMDADGIDVQVVSPTPVFFGYDRPADQAVKLARIFNDLTLETLAGDDRFVPFCQVPLQDPDAACAELDRCRAAGHAGSRSATMSATRISTTPGSLPFSTTAPRPGRRCWCIRGTCRAVRGWTAGWPAG